MTVMVCVDCAWQYGRVQRGEQLECSPGMHHTSLLKISLMAMVEAHDRQRPVVELHEGLGANLLHQLGVCSKMRCLHVRGNGEASTMLEQWR